MNSSSMETDSISNEDKELIATCLPYYPFKGIDRFYDISGILANPPVFQKVISIFVNRYKNMGITSVFGLDARGFVFGPSIASALKIPFFMIRKKGKLCNSIEGSSYSKEYGGDGADGKDILTVSRSIAVYPNVLERCLIIDDLIATGGTLLAAMDLLTTNGCTVVECACIVELKALAGGDKVRTQYPNTNVYTLMDENALTTEGK